MATYIRTAKDKAGNVILPRTVAGAVAFDPAESALTAITVQGAIDETLANRLQWLDVALDVPENGIDADSMNGQDPSYYLDATNIAFDNVASGLTAVTVKTAIDEILTEPHFIGQVDTGPFTVIGAERDNGNSGLSKLINWTQGNHQKVTITGSCVFTFTPPNGACSLILKMIVDATGGYVITLPTGIKWQNGTVPLFSTIANAVDIISLYYDGANYYGVASFNYS